MSATTRNKFVFVAGAASAVVAAVAVAVFVSQGRHAGPSSGSTLASATPTPSASAPMAQPADSAAAPGRAPLHYVFDCAGFKSAEPSTCPAPMEAERHLLELANSYRVSALPCSTTLADSFPAAATALQKVTALDRKKLAPLERALLQNAALELLSCTVKLTDAPARKVTSLARDLVQKLALTDAERGELPSAASLVPAWLGEGTSWRRGVEAAALHTRSEGFARAHQQLEQGNTFADVVRLVLVNQAGTPFVSDVVQRVVQRRKAEDAVHVCIAELAPVPTSCGPAALRAIDPERGKQLLAGWRQTPTCFACHVDNAPRARPFESGTGFEASDASSARIASALRQVLSPPAATPASSATPTAH